MRILALVLQMFASSWRRLLRNPHKYGAAPLCFAFIDRFPPHTYIDESHNWQTTVLTKAKPIFTRSSKQPRKLAIRPQWNHKHLLKEQHHSKSGCEWRARLLQWNAIFIRADHEIFFIIRISFRIILWAHLLKAFFESCFRMLIS